MTILTIDETIGAKIFSEKWNDTYTILYIGSCAFQALHLGMLPPPLLMKPYCTSCSV